MRRSFRRGLALGAASGLAAVLVAEAMRPRGGTVDLLDWDEVARLAGHRLERHRPPPAALERAAASYNQFAAEVRDPLLEAVGRLPPGVRLPDFDALDRFRWIELNVGILRQVMEPLTAVTRVPDSRLVMASRAGLDRYVALVLEFLGRRVLGQFDPSLLGREPVRSALYLVEPNVAAWEREADLPGDDLRRWLILHELTHAWQFETHPWLREHLNGLIVALVESATRTASSRGFDRLRAVTVLGPSQRAVIRQLQATMSVVEGHGNLVMNLVGRRQLASFDRLEAAYRRRSSRRGLVEQLVVRLTGLDMKLEQYRVGERFVQMVHDRHGMAAVDRAWTGPDALPQPEELHDPDGWWRRVSAVR